MDFASMEAAQRWLDAGNRHVRNHNSHYGVSVERCTLDCWRAKTPTQLKMAARRLSNALAYHYPEVFGPCGSYLESSQASR